MWVQGKDKELGKCRCWGKARDVVCVRLWGVVLWEMWEQGLGAGSWCRPLL